MSAQETVPRDWAYVQYGISNDRLRKRVAALVQSHGFWPVDVGGSVYYGVMNADLDRKLDHALQELSRTDGLSLQHDIRVIRDHFNTHNSKLFQTGVVSQIKEDTMLVEKSVDAVEKALDPAANQPLKNPQTGKKSDLLTAGDTRLRSAEKVVEDMEAAIQRFAEGAPEIAEELRLRARQLGTWVSAVRKGFDRWAIVERARRKAKETARGNAKLPTGAGKK